MKLSAAMRLGRVSNLPTVWSNVLAAAALAGNAPRPLALLCLIVGFSALYTAGMYLNDAFDAEFDRSFRPERPIPSGEATMATVFGSGFAMLAAGLAIIIVVGMAFGSSAGATTASGGCLAGAIVLYDAWHKGNPLGPLLMGICRFLVYPTTALAIAGSLCWSVVSAAATVLCYLIGLTYIAKQEHIGSSRRLWPLGLLALPLLYAAFAPPGGAMELVLCAALLGWIIYSLSFLRRPAPAVGKTVGYLIAGISLVDAIFIAGRGQPILAGVAVSCFVATLFLQRWVSGT